MPDARPSALELQSLPDRLRAVQQDVDDAEEVLAHRREQRRRLVHEIVDGSVMSQREIAAALAGKGNKPKSPGLVQKILADPGPDDEE